MDEIKYLCKMKDGGITNVYYDTTYYAGSCPTCNYGASYIDDVQIKLTNTIIKIEATDSYEPSLTEGMLFRILLTNYDEIQIMTEIFFISWLKSKIDEEISADEIDFRVYD